MEYVTKPHVSYHSNTTRPREIKEDHERTRKPWKQAGGSPRNSRHTSKSGQSALLDHVTTLKNTFDICLHVLPKKVYSAYDKPHADEVAGRPITQSLPRPLARTSLHARTTRGTTIFMRQRVDAKADTLAKQHQQTLLIRANCGTQNSLLHCELSNRCICKQHQRTLPFRAIVAAQTISITTSGGHLPSQQAQPSAWEQTCKGLRHHSLR